MFVPWCRPFHVVASVVSSDCVQLPAMGADVRGPPFEERGSCRRGRGNDSSQFRVAVFTRLVRLLYSEV